MTHRSARLVLALSSVALRGVKDDGAGAGDEWEDVLVAALELLAGELAHFAGSGLGCGTGGWCVGFRCGRRIELWLMVEKWW